MAIKQEIKAVIFDVGGVLQLGDNWSSRSKKLPKAGVHVQVAKNIHISIEQYFDAIDQLYAKALEGKISDKEAVSGLARNLGTTKKKLETLYLKAYRKHFKENKELVKYTLNLKKIGYRIAIISDMWCISKKIMIPKKFQKDFNPTIISCDVGLRKPNPKIYKLILKKLKLHAKQVVFIDNQLWNLEPAKKLGMKIILFKNNRQTMKDLKKLGVK